MSQEENITLSVTDIASTSNALTTDDLIAITELIEEESANTNLFNCQGIIIGSSLIGAGILFSLGTVISSHSTFNKYKNRTMVNKLCSSFAIPLTTTGLVLTTYFILNRNKHQCSY